MQRAILEKDPVVLRGEGSDPPLAGIGVDPGKPRCSCRREILQFRADTGRERLRPVGASVRAAGGDRLHERIRRHGPGMKAEPGHHARQVSNREQIHAQGEAGLGGGQGHIGYDRAQRYPRCRRPDVVQGLGPLGQEGDAEAFPIPSESPGLAIVAGGCLEARLDGSGDHLQGDRHRLP